LVAQEEGRGAQRGMAAAPPDEHEAAQEREVGGGVPGAGASLVLQPGGVAGVVVFVLDAPARPRGALGIGGAQGFAGDKHPPARRGRAGGFFQAGALKLDELGGVDKAELLGGDVKGAHAAGVEATVAGLGAGRKKRGAAWASNRSAWAAALG